jgi:RNA polymerase sigma factor for flagellar operon FliA
VDSPPSAGATGSSSDQGHLAGLVEANLWIVDEVIGEVIASLSDDVDRDEMASAGRVGLVEASRVYRDARDQPFADWARLRVRGAVLDAVRDAGWAPRGVHARAAILNAARDALTEDLGRPPTAGELAEACGDVAVELRRSDGDTVRAGLLRRDEIVGSGPGSDAALVTLLLSPATGSEQRSGDYELRIALGNALSALGDQDREIVYAVCLEGRTPSEVALTVGVAEPEVRRTLDATLVGLNAVLRDEWLRRHGFDDGGSGRADQRARGYAEAIRRYGEWYEERRPQFA